MAKPNDIVESLQKGGLFVTIGERIQKARKQLDLTQNQLGKKIGVNPRQLGRYEVGLGHPSLNTLIKISKFAEISLDYLVFGEEKETSKKTGLFDQDLVIILRRVDKLDKTQRNKFKWVIEGMLNNISNEGVGITPMSNTPHQKIAKSA